MPAAGETIIAGRIPGERIATTIAATNSSTTTTTEITVDSVTAALVAGRTYRVRWEVSVDSSVVDDRILGRIREDNDTGTTLTGRDAVVVVATGGGYGISMEAEYTAGSTGSKTFVGTIVRASGTGNVFAHGASSINRYLYVDYIRG